MRVELYGCHGNAENKLRHRTWENDVLKANAKACFTLHLHLVLFHFYLIVITWCRLCRLSWKQRLCTNCASCAVPCTQRTCIPELHMHTRAALAFTNCTCTLFTRTYHKLSTHVADMKLPKAAVCMCLKCLGSNPNHNCHIDNGC